MRYPMPNYPCDFEIPDDWVTEAGLRSFKPSARAYRSTPGAVLVPLGDIEPPCRRPPCSKDWRGFDRVRLIFILKGISTDAEIAAVPLIELPELEFPFIRPFRYRVYNGFHRFYASIAAGFECLPGTVS